MKLHACESGGMIGRFLEDPRSLYLVANEQVRSHLVWQSGHVFSADQGNRVRTYAELTHGKLMGLEPSIVFIDDLEAFLREGLRYITLSPEKKGPDGRTIPATDIVVGCAEANSFRAESAPALPKAAAVKKR